MASLLVENGAVVSMDAHDTIHTHGWVWVDGDRIEGVGAGEAPIDLVRRAGRRIDATHMAVLPGLINGHTHLSQTFVRGLADDKPLLDWLRQVIWPVETAVTAEEIRLACLLGLVENLRCGATSVVQHHKVRATPAHVDAAAEAAATVGVRMLLAHGWVDLNRAATPPDAIAAAMIHLYERWHGAAHGRITVGFGPLAPWRCSDASMRRFVDLARAWGVPTHIHIAEARDEIEILRERTGLRHIEWLDSLGALGPDVHLVHAVWVSDREMDLIARSGAIVVHCPVSNMYLASGFAPVKAMLNRSIPVALGTDGPASNNTQDILETLKVAALLAKVGTGDATTLLPLDILRMATTTGARLFGSEDAGRIAPGVKADLTIVNLNTARSMPVHRPESAVVYNASGPDVHTVIVDGRILLDGGEVTVLDEDALLEECRQAARRLMERAMG